MLLSRVPRYYEAKFCLIWWLMFYQGADKIYRLARTSLKRLSRALPWLFPERKQLTEEEYIETLPKPMRRAAYKYGLERLMSAIRCDHDITRRFGPTVTMQVRALSVPAGLELAWRQCWTMARRRRWTDPSIHLPRAQLVRLPRPPTLTRARPHVRTPGPLGATQLWAMWNKVDPRYLALELISATDLPAMDSSGTTDAYIIAYLVPPVGEAELYPDAHLIGPSDSFRLQHGASFSSLSDRDVGSSSGRVLAEADGDGADLDGGGATVSLDVALDSGDPLSGSDRETPLSTPVATPKLTPVDGTPIQTPMLAATATATGPGMPAASIDALVPDTTAVPGAAPTGAVAPEDGLTPSLLSSLDQPSPGGTPGRRMSAGSKRWSKVRIAQRTATVTSRWHERLFSLPSLVRLVKNYEYAIALKRVATLVRAKWMGLPLSGITAILSDGPRGSPGQYGATYSRVCKRTLNPAWRQRLELRLGGGQLNEDGEYDNQQAPYTSLRVEVWDHDVLSRDDFIGELTVPLCPLMDARVHSYTLPLTDPEGRCGADDGVQGSISFTLTYES